MPEAKVRFSVRKDLPGEVFLTVMKFSAKGKVLVGNSGAVPVREVVATVDYLVAELDRKQDHVTMREPLSKMAKKAGTS